MYRNSPIEYFENFFRFLFYTLLFTFCFLFYIFSIVIGIALSPLIFPCIYFDNGRKIRFNQKWKRYPKTSRPCLISANGFGTLLCFVFVPYSYIVSIVLYVILLTFFQIITIVVTLVLSPVLVPISFNMSENARINRLRDTPSTNKTRTLEGKVESKVSFLDVFLIAFTFKLIMFLCILLYFPIWILPYMLYRCCCYKKQLPALPRKKPKPRTQPTRRYSPPRRRSPVRRYSPPKPKFQEFTITETRTIRVEV